MITPACHNCRAFRPATSECRAQAPQPFVDVNLATKTVSRGRIWPIVKPEDECEAFTPSAEARARAGGDR